ncbi:hypothetical protein EVAR_59362_1 [Eumeta japonica]|uniref:Uncharacterized protein n=1 Tax=Eumeta variegata TaxID=151549 RepID=A0A4C1SQJ5_EUMVA|nr:hypothetical protein EVAR_59362_1 [Eumeta japonica]
MVEVDATCRDGEAISCTRSAKSASNSGVGAICPAITVCIFCAKRLVHIVMSKSLEMSGPARPFRVTLGVIYHFTVNPFLLNSVATHVSLSPDTPYYCLALCFVDSHGCKPTSPGIVIV